MSNTILTIRNLRKSFEQHEIIRGVNLDLMADERHAFIGPNGAGKSTVFDLISGNLTPTSGEITLCGRRIDGKPPQDINRLGLARSFQITNIFPRLTAFENVRLAVMRAHRSQYNFWSFIDRASRILEHTERLLEQIRLERRASAIAGEMTYSEQRSLEIALALASDPKVILLDEPMAGMSSEETMYTADLIREVTKGRALLIVEHDMKVVFSISDRISVLVYGEVIATGKPDEIRNNASVKEAYLGEEVAR
jgi:branched-chain amino acid transport system ATP-binding protein